jgi:hypothetical protein
MILEVPKGREPESRWPFERSRRRERTNGPTPWLELGAQRSTSRVA